jgi:hypothetical protein
MKIKMVNAYKCSNGKTYETTNEAEAVERKLQLHAKLKKCGRSLTVAVMEGILENSVTLARVFAENEKEMLDIEVNDGDCS